MCNKKKTYKKRSAEENLEEDGLEQQKTTLRATLISQEWETETVVSNCKTIGCSDES